MGNKFQVKVQHPHTELATIHITMFNDYLDTEIVGNPGSMTHDEMAGALESVALHLRNLKPKITDTF